MEFSLFNAFQFVVIGTIAGFFGGFLGVGGGAIVIPLLHYWVFPAMMVSSEVIVHLCFGTSLAIISFTSLSATWAQSRRGNISWRIVFLLAAPGIAGSFLGSTASALLSGSVLRVLFGVLLISISIQMFQQKAVRDSFPASAPPATFPTVFVGFLVGIFSGLFGIGGGVLAIPLLVRVLGMPIHRALGISIAFVFFASLVGTSGYMINGWRHPSLPAHTLGYVHLPGWLLAGFPSVFLSAWGVRLAGRTRPARLRRAFALLLMAGGVKMLF